MALPSSGALSLNAIHIEAGGSSGTTASINDSDIRGLISKGSGAQMSFNEWYGASNTIWTTTVTVGSGNNFGYTAYGFVRLGNTYGSATDTTVDFFSGASLISLYYSFTTTGVVVFAASGAQSNAGFTSVNIDGNTYNRTDATFSQPLGTTSWTWDVGSGSGTNPFGTTNGVTKVVTFS